VATSLDPCRGRRRRWLDDGGWPGPLPRSAPSLTFGGRRKAGGRRIQRRTGGARLLACVDCGGRNVSCAWWWTSGRGGLQARRRCRPETGGGGTRQGWLRGWWKGRLGLQTPTAPFYMARQRNGPNGPKAAEQAGCARRANLGRPGRGRPRHSQAGPNDRAQAGGIRQAIDAWAAGPSFCCWSRFF
jgi:hypothetical protein